MSLGFDDFLVRALMAGVGIALVAGPLGCFVVWRRMAYFGDTMAHGALLGIALGTFVGAPPIVGVLVFALGLSGLLAVVSRSRFLGIDSWLGVFSHGALALGLVVISLMVTRVDLLGLLLGDVLAVSWGDIFLIYGAGSVILCLLAYAWQPLLSATIEPDLARAEGVPVGALDVFLMVAVALTVAVAMKVVGILLVTALLVIPAASARPFSKSPEAMALLAGSLGVCGVIGGLALSLVADTPAGPSIVAAALMIFLAGGVAASIFRLARKSADQRKSARF